MKTEEIIIIAVTLVVFLVLVCVGDYVYKKYVRPLQLQVESDGKPKRVVAVLTYYTEGRGWHADFYKDDCLCHGYFLDLPKGQGKEGQKIDAEVLGFDEIYQLGVVI